MRNDTKTTQRGVLTFDEKLRETLVREDGRLKLNEEDPRVLKRS